MWRKKFGILQNVLDVSQIHKVGIKPTSWMFRAHQLVAEVCYLLVGTMIWKSKLDKGLEMTFIAKIEPMYY
jgi:hypothetical protein